MPSIRRTTPPLAVLDAGVVRIFLLCLAMTFAGFVALTGSVRAAEPASAIVVFDASGSMWGTLSGTKAPKFEIARDLLRKSLAKHAIGEVSARPRIGVATFGGGARASCTDGLVVEPTASFDEAKVFAPLDKLNPRGRGPLVMAMENAAKDLASTKGAKALLIIHDGADNCRRDACEAAKAIHAADPTLKIHSIGIALQANEADTLTCSVKETGGSQFAATDVTELVDAIEKAVALALRNPSANQTTTADGAAGTSAALSPVGVSPAGVASAGDGGLNAGVRIVPGLAGRQRLLMAALMSKNGPEVEGDVQWIITEAKSEGRTPAVRATGRRPEVSLPPGHYTLRVRTGDVSRLLSIETTKDHDTIAVANLDAGLVKIDVGLGLSVAPPASDAVVTLRRLLDTAEGREAGIVYAGPVPATALKVAAGSYELHVRAGTIELRKQLTVAAASQTTASLALAAGLFKVEARPPAGVPDSQDILLSVATDTGDPSMPGVEVARSAAGRASFIVPAGTYRLTARNTATVTSQLVAIGPGETQTRVLDLATAPLDVRVMIGDRLAAGLPLRIAAVRQNARASSPPRGPAAAIADQSETRDGTSRFQLGPETYRIEARVAGTRVEAAETIAITSVAAKSIEIALPAGFVKFPGAATTMAAGTGGPPLIWEVRSPNGMLVWRAFEAAELSTALAPGSYTVRLIGKSGSREQPLTVTEGQQHIVRFGE